jgi:single-strand DNA-binding protein
MAFGNQVTIVGNLTRDPELRYTPGGVAVANFDVAVNRRTRDASGEWKEADPSFFRCNVWRQQAENVAESLTKGTRVIVTGSLRQRSWETPEGQKRTTIELEVETCGPALEWAKAQVTRTPREGGGDAPSFASTGASTGGSNGASVGAVDEEPPF